jgi:hypothetical protein
VDVEGGSAGAPLLGHLHLLLGVEVGLEYLEHHIAGLLLEVLLRADLLVVQVLGLSILKGMGVVRVLGSQGLAEIGKQKFGVLVSVESSGEVVHIVFVGKNPVLN